MQDLTISGSPEPKEIEIVTLYKFLAEALSVIDKSDEHLQEPAARNLRDSQRAAVYLADDYFRQTEISYDESIFDGLENGAEQVIKDIRENMKNLRAEDLGIIRDAQKLAGLVHARIRAKNPASFSMQMALLRL